MAETELDRFFRENRLREAQSVNPSVFEDPRYASMIYNSSVPLNQLEKNIQQSQGYMLEPVSQSRSGCIFKRSFAFSNIFPYNTF